MQPHSPIWQQFRSPEGGAFALALCLLFAAGIAAAATVPEIAARVDQRYNHLETLQADFTETYRGAGVSKSESGVLWLKRPGKMLWDYREPQPKVFITDGKWAWFYVPGERQARKAAVKKLDDLRSPLRYLLGKAKLEKELTGLSLAAEVSRAAPGDIVLIAGKGHEDYQLVAGRRLDFDDRAVVRALVAEREHGRGA